MTQFIDIMPDLETADMFADYTMKISESLDPDVFEQVIEGPKYMCLSDVSSQAAHAIGIAHAHSIHDLLYGTGDGSR